VPSVVNVNRNVWVWASEPESNAAVSEVAVCALGPLLVQQTVVPAATFKLLGEKE